MDYVQYNTENSNFPYNLSQSNQNQINLDNIEKINNSINDNYKKYIMNNNQKIQNTLDIDSSREEINSKEEIIQTKDEEEEIDHLGSGKFRFLNTFSEKENNKKEIEMNDEKQDYKVNNIAEKQISNSDNKNDNSNKITNNICIIINKPEMQNKDMEEENKKNIIFEYLNTFGKGEEENNSNNDSIKKSRYTKSQKVNKKNKRPLFEKINKNKKNSYKESLKYKNDHLLKSNNSFGHNYFYSEREDYIKGSKQTLHKVLSQKQQKLKDLQKNIDNKTIALKDKKSQIDKLENKHTRSITFGEEKQFIKNNNGLDDLIKQDNSDYNIIQKNKVRNKNNYYKLIKNSYTINKSLNSEDKYFKDIPMTNIQTNKYNYLEQQIYRTMSPEIDKSNISFNKSIEEKRKMLGIPLKENDYEMMNKRIEDDLNENKENLNQKLMVHRKKQDEVNKIYEKRNKTNQENIENLYKNVHKSYNGKSKSKTKNPIRILYKDYSKPIYSHNNYEHNITSNFFNEIKSNSNLNIELRNKNIHYNNSYIFKRKDMEKTKKHYSNSQNDIFSYKKAKNNKTNNEKDKSLIKRKIKIYKDPQNKDIYKKNKEQNDLRCFSMLSENNINNNNNQKEKKIYENKSYYSKLLSKILNIKNKELYSIKKKKSIKAQNNNTINNINTNKNYINNINSNYMSNLLINNIKKNELNINLNNPKNESQPYKGKEVLSPQKNDEIMTVENNERGKTIHIIKKRNRSPQINQSNQSIQQTSPEIKKQTIKIESKNKDNEKEQIKVEKKEYKNNLRGPGRGISALRRINQKIENYKKSINTRKRRQSKSKNPQFKSSSQLKQKFGKYVFLKVKQNKSINNLPNVNKDFQNFDFIDNI